MCKFHLLRIIITNVVLKSDFPLKCKLDFKPISKGHFPINTKGPTLFRQTRLRQTEDRNQIRSDIEPLFDSRDDSTSHICLSNPCSIQLWRSISLQCVFLMCYKISRNSVSLNQIFVSLFLFGIHFNILWYNFCQKLLSFTFSLQIYIYRYRLKVYQ